MQGQLRNEYLSLAIQTKCAHCRRPLLIEIDSDLKYRLEDAKAEPLVFMPEIQWQTFREPNIIHAY